MVRLSRAACAAVGVVFCFSGASASSTDRTVESYREKGQQGVSAAIEAKVPDAVLDQVCRQHDCRASRLYWHTNLTRALETARAEGKPVLSLRLLGKLDEELSCANSRFFRTLLYSDPKISALLREKFVLHWRSERPAPRITVEFGDGRKMVQTVTGNSIHYLLDSDGRVLDALPGLYAPGEFRSAIEDFAVFWKEIGPLRDPAARDIKLVAFHRYQARSLEKEWARPLPAVAAYTGGKGRAPASVATGLAATKRMVQMPSVRELPQPPASEGQSQLKQLMEDPIWSEVGRTRAAKVRISNEAEALVRSKLGHRSDEEIRQTLDRLRVSLATDGLRNDYVYRRALHSWLAQEGVDRTLEGLNRRVYETLFLSPAHDPWMGLKPDGVYTGIQGDGLSTPQ